MSVFDTLKDRGFVFLVSDEEKLRAALERDRVTVYCGYDPTAPSLHMGHLVSIMMLAHLQRAGHRPIVVVGGGTGMIGDPTDKTEMRKLLTPEEIQANMAGLRPQFERYLDFEEGDLLIMTASGGKMGKTAAGAVWLDPIRTSPYDYYQYWINTADADVERFLGLFTFLPMEEVRELGRLEGADLRRAKEVLAFEATMLTHGEDAAEYARTSSRALFGGDGEAEGAPTTPVAASRLAAGVELTDLLVETGVAPSKRSARVLIRQGGAYVNGERVTAV